MPRAGLPILTAAVALAAAAGLLSAVPGPGRAGAGALLAAASLSVPECTEVDSGESFELEIAVSGVNQLTAWEVYFAYDPEILEVTGKDVRILLDKNRGSNVFDFSDPVPNTDGIYRVAAADLSTEDAAEDGSGVLARLTLRAKARGASYAAIFRGDYNGDTVTDLGPTLTASGGKHIDDRDGDAIFDGAISSGQVAVDRPCIEPPPTPAVEDAIIIGAGTPAVTVGPGQSPAPTSAADPSPSPGESPAPETTPVPARTPQIVSGEPGGPAITDDGSGFPAWVIAALGAIGAVSLASVIAIIYAARRSA